MSSTKSIIFIFVLSLSATTFAQGDPMVSEACRGDFEEIEKVRLWCDQEHQNELWETIGMGLEGLTITGSEYWAFLQFWFPKQEWPLTRSQKLHKAREKWQACEAQSADEE